MAYKNINQEFKYPRKIKQQVKTYLIYLAKLTFYSYLNINNEWSKIRENVLYEMYVKLNFLRKHFQVKFL